MSNDQKKSSKGLCPDLPIEKFSPQQTDDLHACMGLNTCAGKDIFGIAKEAGAGYCATAVPHVCKTMNECKGQGGCGLFGSAEEQCYPGQNSCQYQGTCGTPIQAERFATGGPNMNKSVWVLARKRFEQVMAAKKAPYADSPCQYGPPEEWLDAVFEYNNGEYDSCGSSGDKRCSYGYGPSADDKTKAMVKESQDTIDKTAQQCETLD